MADEDAIRVAGRATALDLDAGEQGMERRTRLERLDVRKIKKKGRSQVHRRER